MKSAIAVSVLAMASSMWVAAEDTRINWRDWHADAFFEAREQGRPILINVGHEGCSACRFMERNTFSDARVIELVNEHFVAIQVDSEARPDIGERYSDWAWPANAFMRPDGTQVLAFAGSRRPDKYLAVLNQVLSDHKAGTLTADKAAPYGAPDAPQTTPLIELREQIRSRQDRVYRNKKPGIFENAEPLLSLMFRASNYGDSETLEHVKTTLNGLTQQLDPVWGGMFYGAFGRWDNVVHEKRLESQAAALQAFSAGFSLTGDVRYRDAIANVHTYLTTFMEDGGGGFYANQQDHLTLPIGMSWDDYYSLDDEGRRAIGIPTIDHAVYTDVSARVALGYVMAYEATGERRYLESAKRTMSGLSTTRQTHNGWYRQFVAIDALDGDRRIHTLTTEPIPYLRTQAHVGLALLALHGATADPRWEIAATQVASAMLEEFEDSELGGFYGAADDGTPGRRKPLEDNAAAARFLYLTSVLVKSDTLKHSAERAIRASASPEVVRREGKITGNLAVALETMTVGYVEFSVVGEATDPRTNELLNAARRVYQPRKVVHIESAGRYPKRDAPTMYICNDDACSIPIFDPDDVERQASRFLLSSQVMPVASR